MSLMRAFTTKLRKTDAGSQADEFHLGRAASQRAGKPILRSQISSPLALVSTTNPLSYHAPNIAGTKRIQTRNVSTSSADTFSTSTEDSEFSTISVNTSDAGSTATDASSVEHSPVTPEPEFNHLSCYFRPAVDTSSPSMSPELLQTVVFEAPAIPKRVPSHSKKAHETMHRKKSLQRRFSPAVHPRSSTEIFSPLSFPPEELHVEVTKESYFGNELAKLNEVAEDFGVMILDQDHEADLAAMNNNNLACFGAADYYREIEYLVHNMFRDDTPRWI